MTAWKARQWLTAASAVLVLALLAFWLTPGASGAPRYRWQAPAPQAPDVASLGISAIAPNAALAQASPNILARPLFSESRRPPPPTPTAAASAPPPPVDELDKVQLVGILGGPGLVGILARVDGSVRLVKRGEAVGGWRLDGVDNRSASFVRDGVKRQLVLAYAHQSPGAAGAVAPSVPAAPPRGADASPPRPPPAMPQAGIPPRAPDAQGSKADPPAGNRGAALPGQRAAPPAKPGSFSGVQGS